MPTICERELKAMKPVLSGIQIAVIGGDDREITLIRELLQKGASVFVCGFPREVIDPGASIAESLEKCFQDADVIIFPLPGINAAGFVRAKYAPESIRLTEKTISMISSNTKVFIGKAPSNLRHWILQQGAALFETLEMDEIAILNSIPTAEGALQLAMEETEITLHGSNACIIGFGRVGTTLGTTLKALGSEVVVVSREGAELARAYAMGCRRASLNDLDVILSQADIIFNTIPHRILDYSRLENAHPDLLIIDIAAEPGGTDFKACQELGIRAIHALGLPGKVAPVSAGRMMAQVISRFISSIPHHE